MGWKVGKHLAGSADQQLVHVSYHQRLELTIAFSQETKPQLCGMAGRGLGSLFSSPKGASLLEERFSQRKCPQDHILQKVAFTIRFKENKLESEFHPMLQQWPIFSSQRKYSAFVPLKNTTFKSYTLFSEFLGKKISKKKIKSLTWSSGKKMETKNG